MNFYLLCTILLIAVCQLTQANDEAYGTVRTIACINISPPVNCPYLDEQQCDTYCRAYQKTDGQFQGRKYQCPSGDHVECPYSSPLSCLNYCAHV